MDDYWNNIDYPGLKINKEEYYDWLKNSKVINEYYLYHDFSGGYERVCILEKDGYEYHLTDFNGFDNRKKITYIIHRIKRCPSQDGDGI